MTDNGTSPGGRAQRFPYALTLLALLGIGLLALTCGRMVCGPKETEQEGGQPIGLPGLYLDTHLRLPPGTELQGALSRGMWDTYRTTIAKLRMPTSALPEFSLGLPGHTVTTSNTDKLGVRNDVWPWQPSWWNPDSCKRFEATHIDLDCELFNWRTRRDLRILVCRDDPNDAVVYVYLDEQQ